MNRRRGTRFFPLGLAAAGLFVAGAQGELRSRANAAEEQRRFDELSRRAVARVYERFALYEYGLRGARGAIIGAGGSTITHARFREYAASREESEFPGARGFGFIRWIPKGTEGDLVASNQAQGRLGFQIKQLAPHDGDAFVIDYIEPESRNGPSVGLDIGSEATRRKAALDAAERGSAVLTHPLTLVQAAGLPKQGFLLLLPVYRPGAARATSEERLQATLGWTYSPLVMEEILQSFDTFDGEFALSLADVSDDGAPEIFYASPGAEEPAIHGLTRQSRLPIYGRSWSVEVRARPPFADRLNLEKPLTPALWTGLLSVLLACLLYVYLRNVDRHLAAAMEQSRLAAIVRDSSDGIIATSETGVVTSWNRGAERLFGFSEAEAVGKALRSLVLPEDRLEEEDTTLLTRIRGGEELAPFTTVRKDRAGHLLDVSVAFSPLRGPDGAIVGASSVVRDIRAEKDAEDRLREVNATLERQVEERTRDLAQRNRQLESAHEELENLIDTAPFAILAVDEAGTIELVNAEAARIFARTRDDLVGRALTTLLPNTVDSAPPGERTSLLGTPGSSAVNTEEPPFGLRPDGSKFPVEIHLGKVTTARGPRTLVTIADISERRRQEALILDYSVLQAAILSQVGYAILAANQTFEITLANPAAERLTGYPSDELLGKTLTDLLVGDGTAPAARLHAAEKLGNETEWLLARKDGRHVPISVRAAPLQTRGEGSSGHLAVAADLTERKQVELALRQAVDASEAANRAKGEFLANMSHEIRTPMNAILGMAYLLEKAELPVASRDTVKKIHAAGRSLLGILNDILDFSKIEAGRFDIERAPFRLSDLLGTLATMLSASTGYRPVEILVGPAPTGADYLWGDALRLSQVLTNLSTNAVKFTERGEVVVSVAAERLEAGKVSLRFSVRDTGMGIAPEHRAEIFSPFAQADASITRRFGGTGLGLAISARLVELLGGALELESEVGKGSTFAFTLPFDLAVPSQFSQPSVVFQRVLVADDHAVARELLTQTITSLGWHAESVATGEAAIAAVEAAAEAGSPFDILLLDWQMPTLDGLAVAAQLRARQGAHRPPVIVMVTAMERALLLAHADHRHVDEVLSKPVTASALLEVITELKRQRGELAPSAIVESAEPRLRGVRVLVVDDREINREVASRILEHEGAVVTTADDGQAAVEMLSAEPTRFDVVLMDIQMPVMDGYEATRQIRQIPELRGLPVVALTAGAFRNQHDAALAAGMDGFVAKAFDVNDLVHLLRDLTRAGRKTADPPELPRSLPFAEASTMSPLPAPSRATNAAELPLLDRTLGQSLLRSEASYKRVLELFARTHANDEDALLSHLARGETAECASLAHKLRGAAASLALRRVAFIAGELELALKEGRGPGELTPSLIEALRATREEIGRYVGTVAAPGGVPASPPAPLDEVRTRRCIELVETLMGALEDADPNAAEPLLARLGESLSEAELRPLRELIEEFDFPRAKATASGLLERLVARRNS